ncbi:MAG: hypothetical protein PHG75_06105 [Syntrophomonas sp.]|nr:hypothetical protein [Syntrophomonas sp.]
MIENTYLEKVVRLVQLISGDATEIGEEIRHYATYPAAFRNSHYAEQAAIGAERYPDPEDLPGYPENLCHTFLWNIVYGILRTRQHLLKLDSDASGETAHWAIATLLERQGQAGIHLETATEATARSVQEVLRQAAALLEKEGLALAWIDDGSDSGPILIVPATDLLELLTIGSELGVGIGTDFD